MTTDRTGVKPDSVKPDDNKPDDTRWKSDAAKRGYASDDGFDMDSGEGDPNVPMIVHTENYTDNNGIAKTRTFKVPQSDFAEFQRAREAKLNGE